MIINIIYAIQVNVFMLILLFTIAVHACFTLNKKEQVNRLFLTLIFLAICLLILEILSVVLNSSNYIDFIVAHKAVDTLGFSLTPAVPIIAALYAYNRTNKYKKIFISKCKWLLMPFAVNGILSFGSYHFNWIFSITAENLYVRGPLFLVSPITSYFYYIIHLLVLYKSRKKITREELAMLSCLTLIPAVMSAFQLYYFIYLTIWSSVALAVAINYIFIMHSQAKRDPLTGLGNRLAYDEYLASLDKKCNLCLSVINIDMDDFKHINDVFGHREGDKALKIFAKKLQEIFEGIGVTIRWGGDEFIVFLNEKRRITVEKYINKLNDKVNEYNEENTVPYRIQFSYGIAIFDDSYDNIHEFIRHSDKLMYEEKRKKKCQLK